MHPLLSYWLPPFSEALFIPSLTASCNLAAMQVLAELCRGPNTKLNPSLLFQLETPFRYSIRAIAVCNLFQHNQSHTWIQNTPLAVNVRLSLIVPLFSVMLASEEVTAVASPPPLFREPPATHFIRYRKDFLSA